MVRSARRTVGFAIDRPDTNTKYKNTKKGLKCKEDGGVCSRQAWVPPTPGSEGPAAAEAAQ